MAESDVTRHLLDFANRWAADMRGAEAGSVELEALVMQLALELQAESERATKGADERFDAFYRHCPLPVLLTDTTGVISAANPAFLRLIGRRTEDELVGTHISSLAAGEQDRDALRDALSALLSTPQERVRNQLVLVAEDETTRSARLSATTLPGPGPAHPIFMFEDLGELTELQELFRHQGLHDQLTGLPNATHFRSRLETIVGTNGGRQAAVLLVDIDGFAVINEGLGVAAADDVLRHVAGVIGGVFADERAFVARLHGDVFAVALFGELSPPSVVQVTERLIEELAKPVFDRDGAGIGISVSVGIVVADAAGAVHLDLIRSAKTALRQAKEFGKAQWVLFDSNTGETARQHSKLATAIAGALEFGELGVIYQPHVVLPDAEIAVTLNAVLRWEHPTLGDVRAEQIYPLAETTGMLVPLARYLLSQALRTTADWRARFGDQAPMICVRVPQRLAVDGDLVHIVRAELANNALEPNRLMLCTDGPSLLDGRGDLLDSIGHLAGLGVRFVLDISGLPDLELVPALRLPVPGVMLFGPMVDEIALDEPPDWARRNVEQLVQRAAELDVKVGAHGVRTKEHAQRLADLGVVVGSGPYLTEHPDSDDAEVWVGHAFPVD